MLVALHKTVYECYKCVKSDFLFLMQYDWAATVHHREFLFRRRCSSACEIEAGGHGVSPFLSQGPRKDNIITYHDYKLVNLDNEKLIKWLMGDLKVIFNKNAVNTPDQWNDWRIRQKLGKASDGLIWRDPERLYQAAVQMKLMPEVA